MVRLEGLVFAAKAEQDRVLQVGREDYILVTGLARHLDTQVPRGQGDEGEVWRIRRLSVLVDEVLFGVGVEGHDGVTEGTSIADMLPSEGGQGGAERSDWRVDRFDEHTLVMQLYSMAMGSA